MLNIPIPPDFPILPERTSIVHRKSQLVIGPEEGELSYPAKILQVVRKQNLKVEVVPVTTGLKFLYDNKSTIALQRKYLERLRRDPDFINKELFN